MLPIHALADLFPLMEGKEFEDLCAAINAHGLINPIIVHEGRILDGRNRYRAFEELNRPFIAGTLVEFSTLGLDCTPEQYIWSANVARRHMTPDQIAMMAIEFADHERAEAKKRETAGKGADGSGGRGHKRNPGQETGQGLRAPKTAQKLARENKVSRQKIEQAQKVKATGSQELTAKVISGELKLKDAAPTVKPKPKSSPSERKAVNDMTDMMNASHDYIASLRSDTEAQREHARIARARIEMAEVRDLGMVKVRVLSHDEAYRPKRSKDPEPDAEPDGEQFVEPLREAPGYDWAKFDPYDETMQALRGFAWTREKERSDPDPEPFNLDQVTLRCGDFLVTALDCCPAELSPHSPRG